MRQLLGAVGILLFSSFSAIGQNGPKINYDEFKVWMKQTDVNGFSFVDAELENGDYVASFMHLNRLISIRLSNITSFERYKNAKGYDGATPYDLQGTKSVYVSGPSTTSIYISSPKMNATLIISTNYYKLEKAAMEKIVAEIGLGIKF